MQTTMPRLRGSTHNIAPIDSAAPFFDDTGTLDHAGG